MNIPKNIQFKDLNQTLFIKKGDSGYNELKKINNEGNWVDYVNEMLQNQISVRYDYSTDTFVCTPISRTLKEKFNLSVEDEYEDELGIEDIINDVLPNAIEKGIENAFQKLKTEIYSGIIQEPDKTSQISQDNLDLIKDNKIDWTERISFEKDNDYIHPDLERLAGLTFSNTSKHLGEDEFEEEVELYSDNKFYDVEYEEEDDDEIVYNNCEEEIEIDGTPVKIILNNIFIKNSEINLISELAKEAGTKLKALNGQDDILEIFVESKTGDIHKIECIDRKNIAFPFTCQNKKFKNLNEAIRYANVNLSEIEQRVFKNSLNENLYKRSLNSHKDADIFEWLKEANIKTNETWTVRDLGYVNLKNGLNERLSDITQLDNAKNTLVVNKYGEYILFKGNLKERSAKGVKKELIKEHLNRRTTLGEYKVVGQFDNTLEGLGEIMYICKKSQIKLMNWK